MLLLTTLSQNCIISDFINQSTVRMNVVEMLQKQFQDAATNLQTVQKDYQKVLADRQTLDSQLSENKQVKEELDLAGDGTKVFKLIGPALVNQDLTEAKGNVEKRIEYIRYKN